MIGWRIAKAKRANDLSGRGAALAGGRWNELDVPAIYMGCTPAICSLETFVHTGSYPLLPLKITRFILPPDPSLYLQPDPATLPEGWQAIPADIASMRYGTRWLKANTHLGLIVPSAILPLEYNIVLNPAHPAISDVVMNAQYDFLYDERMFSPRV